MRGLIITIGCGLAAALALLLAFQDASTGRADAGGVSVVAGRYSGPSAALMPPAAQPAVSSNALAISLQGLGGPSLKSGTGVRTEEGGALDDFASQLRREGRDPVWAGRSEALLRDQLARDLSFGAPPAKVKCMKTLCEITGSLPRSFGGEQASSALQALQGAEMRSVLPDGILVAGPFLTNQTGEEARYKLFFRREEL